MNLPIDLANPNVTAATTSGGWTCGAPQAGGVLTCTQSGSLPAGQSFADIVITGTVPSDPSASAVSVQATLINATDVNPLDDSVSETVQIVNGPDLSIAIAPASWSTGDTGSISVSLANVGSMAASGVTAVAIAIPAALTAPVLTSQTGWSCGTPAADASLECVRSDVLAAGAAYPPILISGSSTLAFGTVAQVQAFSINSLDVNPTNDSAFSLVPVSGPDLAVSLSSEGAWSIGEAAALTVRVTNVGSAATTAEVAVSLSVPSYLLAPSLSAASATGGWTCDGLASGATASCANQNLLGPASELAPLVVLGSVAAGAASSTVIASASTPGDTNALNDETSIETIIGASPPSAPQSPSAVAGNGQATISFLPPFSDGGAPIIGYTVLASPGGLTASGPSSPLTVIGLTNGTAYTFTVTATNSAGTGPPSVASNSVTPADVPGPPTIGAATAGDGSVSVSFTPPLSDGGSPIIGYTVTCDPGGHTGTGTTSPISVSGLTNGTAYTCTVTASNAAGTSEPSSASNPAMPVAPASSFTLTGPSGGAIGQASSPFTVKPDAVYTGTITITPSGGGLSTPIVLTFSSSSEAQTFTIAPLEPGPVTLTPSNSGSLADPTALTYNTPPGAPAIGSATAGNGSVSVSFTPPLGDGGSPVTGYTATCDPGGAHGNRDGQPDHRLRAR